MAKAVTLWRVSLRRFKRARRRSAIRRRSDAGNEDLETLPRNLKSFFPGARGFERFSEGVAGRSDVEYGVDRRQLPPKHLSDAGRIGGEHHLPRLIVEDLLEREAAPLADVRLLVPTGHGKLHARFAHDVTKV
jgi:hypothetical protein